MSKIQSPLPGTFYTKASPEADNYKAKGDAVAVGDTVGLVEVMKTFIEIKSEISGVFGAYDAPNGDPVTAGQDLAEVTVG